MNLARGFQSAIKALNGLQSNAAVLNLLKHKRQLRPDGNLLETEHFLERTGIKISDLDRLNIVHVAGTKGKGSVCAMTESILRHRGLKTGFYSSPHLIHVRERIRINGQPLSEEKFASYFWKVYDRLVETKASGNVGDGFQAMPAYFKFLTIMSFHVFLEEQVDVAVVEVGIGGAYDCTNVIKHPVVCGITILDLDHTSVLGDTLEQIAWQKGGIMKPNSIAITMNQPDSCLAVLSKRSAELECHLYRCPPFSSYGVSDHVGSGMKFGIPGRQQMDNASLSLQLARLWLRRRENPAFMPECIDETERDELSLPPILKPLSISSLESQALERCRWPGRSQTLTRGTTTFLVDGAHTPKSMQLCVEWFQDASSKQSDSNCDIIRILMFNCTSDRKPETLLSFLVDCDFDCAIFCPNMIYTEVDTKSDQANLRVSHERQMERCEECRKAWLALNSTRRRQTAISNGHRDEQLQAGCAGGISIAMSPIADSGRTLITEFANALDWRGHYPDASLEFKNFDYWSSSNGVCPASNKVTAVFPCISSALAWINVLEKSMQSSPNRRLQVLVTGSLHLVGGVLSILDPNLNK